jgi:hypothetical protein
MRVARQGVTLALGLAAVLLAGCDHDGEGTGDPGAGAGPVAGSPGDGGPGDGGPGGGSGGGAPDPCALLTEGEVGTAVGSEVSRVEGPVERFQGVQCTWFFPDELLGEAEVSLTAWVGVQFYSPDGPGADVTGFEEVAGIGEAAHRWPPGQGLCTAIYRQGDLVVQVLSMTDDDSCVDLARVSAGRL